MNRLDASALNAACEAEALPWRVQVVDEIGSTSDSVREAALAGESTGLVLFAESQTAGRGRRDNRWITPGGKDLMFSMLLRPQEPTSLWPRLTTLAALAICQPVASRAVASAFSKTHTKLPSWLERSSEIGAASARE